MAVLYGPEAIYLYNDATARTLGARHPQALGQPFFESFPESRVVLEATYAHVWRGETVTATDRRPAHRPSDAHGDDAGESLFKLSFAPLRDERGVVVGALVTSPQLPALASFEGALLTSEARLRLALDLAELGTWTWEIATSAGDLDTRGAEIVGLPAGRLENVVEAQFAAIHPEDVART